MWSANIDVQYNPPMSPTLPPTSISVVIPTYNGASYLQTCLESLNRQTLAPDEILIVDNASTDGSADVVRTLAPAALVLRQRENTGFAAAANAGIEAAAGEWIAVLNNDIELADNWLEECAAAARRHPAVAFVACRILDFADRSRVYSAGDCFLRAGFGYRRGQQLQDREEFTREREIFAACACAALYRKSLLAEVGGFDRRFFAYLEDVDLGLRLRAAGHFGIYTGAAVVHHHGGATSGGEFSSLAVRLRTRNSILLLCKSLPAGILARCLPMIAAGQLAWFARVLRRGKLGSYAAGLAAAIPQLPAMLRERRRIRKRWPGAARRLWHEISRSEALARQDFTPPRARASTFLKWYFRIF